MELNQIAESIGAINTPTIGIAGEVRCVITGVDGEVKTDTGFQKNLILNQGLDFFGGGKGGSINAYCAIGSGNSAPAITQTGLDAYIAKADGTDTTSSYAYTDTGDGMYRMWEQKKYRFTGLSNVNISEVGLVSTGTTSENYYLTTRALIKDSADAPTSISIKTGETLDIYYKIHKVVDTRDKSFVINVLDGNGGSVPYNAVVRPNTVGNSDWRGAVSAAINTSGNTWLSPGELGSISGSPTGGTTDVTYTLASYITNSYKRSVTISAALSSANFGIRTAFRFSQNESLFPFQIRFGRVSDDAPLTKTANDTLTIPLEFSWGRYEGAL